MIPTAQDFLSIVTSNFDLGLAEFKKIFGPDEVLFEHLWDKYVEFDRRIDIFMQRLDTKNLNALYAWMVDHAREVMPGKVFEYERIIETTLENE